jgi:hypothetical protein
VTSEAKIASNRRNAQRSTGPRTALAKARVRRNALRHGFAADVVRDIATLTEVGRIAAALCDPQALPLDRERALIVAESQVTLKRIRRTRADIMEQISPAPPTKQSDESGTVPSPQTESSQRCLDELLRIERYERRALSRRKRAARLLRNGFAASSLASCTQG